MSSRTFIADIRDGAFPPISVDVGTFVVWRNLDPVPHSAEALDADPLYFNAGALLPGETSSPILFEKRGAIRYYCRFHSGMEGAVHVSGPSDTPPPVEDHHGDHGNHHSGGVHSGHSLHHFHGFVTGGRSGDRLFMSHTPVLADTRHNYQVILRGKFAKPEHAAIYNSLRQTDYGDQVVQIFHAHMSMADIGMGAVKQLPNATVAFWPGGTQTTIGPAQQTIPGLEDVPIDLEEVIHFHQFDTDADYPDALSYIMYGDADDIFIDHFMNRAPSFHSVAKLAEAPSGWLGSGKLHFQATGRRIRDVPPKLLSRVAMVDNAFHLFWLLPHGTLPRQFQDPLIVRGNTPGQPHAQRIRYDDGTDGEIRISRFLHFDIRLLNYGVFIV